MSVKVSTTGRIRLTLEIDWDHSFDGKATAADIYTTVARECTNEVMRSLREAGVTYRLIGEVEPLMVIHPVKRP